MIRTRVVNNVWIALTGTLLLSGCASEWVKTRSDAQDYLTARTHCETDANNTFPVRNEVAQRTRYAEVQQKCNSKKKCDGKKYESIRLPEVESYVMDVNYDSRDQLFQNCMAMKGWESRTKWLEF